MIKIENPGTGGDDTRSWSTPFAPTIVEQPEESKGGKNGLRQEDWSQLPEESAYFLAVNRGKRSVGVNLKDKDGLRIVHELIAQADILVRALPPSSISLLTPEILIGRELRAGQVERVGVGLRYV